MVRSFCRAFLAFGFVATAQAQVPTDFNADGTSDITLVAIQSDKALAWKTQPSGTSTVQDLGLLGVNGNHLVLGRWFASASINIATVSLDSESKIKWTVRDSGGVDHTRTFGKSGDLVISGADFNSDGTTDAVVGRLNKSSAVWDLSTDLFTSSTPATSSFTFGKSGDRAFFARIEGTNAWLGTVRKGTGRKSLVRYKNIVTNEVRTYSRFPEYAAGSQRPRPVALKQASGADILAFQLSKGANTQFRFTTFSGQSVGDVEFDGTGIAVVGDFNSGAGEELAFQNDTTLFIHNPTLGETREFPALGSILVDEVNINTITSDSTTTPPTNNNPTPPSNGGGDEGSNPGASCSTTKAWPGTLVYKTIGSTHFSDSRRNAIGLIAKIGYPGPYNSCVSAIDTKGNVVAKLGLYARGAGWAARWYQTLGCGAGSPMNGNAVASRARANTGSSNIYMNIGGVCYGPIDATKCIGSQQC